MSALRYSLTLDGVDQPAHADQVPPETDGSYLLFGSLSRRVKLRRLAIRYGGTGAWPSGGNYVAVALARGASAATIAALTLTDGTPMDAAEDVAPTAGWTQSYTSLSTYGSVMGGRYAFTWVGDSYEWNWDEASAISAPIGTYFSLVALHANNFVLDTAAAPNYTLSEVTFEWTE